MANQSKHLFAHRMRFLRDSIDDALLKVKHFAFGLRKYIIDPPEIDGGVIRTRLRFCARSVHSV